MLTLLVRSSAG